MRTSYSALETYLQCPQRYKFQAIDRIRVPKSREALFGSLVHETLRFMFQHDPLFPTLDEVVDYFRSHWPAKEVLAQEMAHDPLKRSWTDQEEHLLFEDGVRMLKKYYEKNAPWNFNVVDLESHFEVTLVDDRTGNVHVLAGIIDRIDKLPDGSYEIIDYKTSKRMPSQALIDENLQLSLYSLGLQKRWPHLTSDDITLSLYFLKHGEKLSTKQTRQAIDRTQTKIAHTIRDIEERLHAGKPFEPMPGPLCNWCGYRPFCPAWKHLYRKQGATEQISQEEIDKKINEYLGVRKEIKQKENHLSQLQQEIKAFMEQQGLTRVFCSEGVIAKKIIQRYGYDEEKIKSLLVPLGKWEDILKMDDKKLKHLIKEAPLELRSAIEETRKIIKEYTVLAVSEKKNVPEGLKLNATLDKKDLL